MTIRNLDGLFHPRNIVLVGASDRPGAVGSVVLDNLLAAGFAGAVHGVNPRLIDRAGMTWSPSIEALAEKEQPDLAIIATPAATVPGLVDTLGAMGAKVAIVLSAGIGSANGLRQAMLDAARPHLLRVVGPNCVGLLMPHARLNASFAGRDAAPGGLALISQSGALITAMLDWAADRAIGFSGVVSVGEMADVDLGDLIDLFAADPRTDAILIYVEGVTNPAKFMAAARAAARLKPVIAIKAGRSASGAKAALSHTGALAGAYDVYQAAFRRAGIVMVDTLGELFDAAETLCKQREIAGNRVGIVTNGGGAGILAVDALEGVGAQLATLSPDTIGQLDANLPATWSRANPVDIIGDAKADRYAAAISAVAADPAVDALLVINCPTAITSGADAAVATITALGPINTVPRKPAIACWLGGPNINAVRPRFATANLPLFDDPARAVRGIGHLLAAKRARQAMMRAPAIAHDQRVDRAAVNAIFQTARGEGRTLLNEVEAKTLLAAYGIPVGPTRLARSVDDVADVCAMLEPPYAVKIVSPQITHKSDVGGVVLDLVDGEAAEAAARAMRQRIELGRPEATITGFAVQSMIQRRGAHELIVGIATDATFGPILMVGSGGKAVEILRDRALGLPPLDDELARAMVNETRIARLLAGYRDEPPSDVAGTVRALIALSSMAADWPEIAELDINPLLVDADGVIALDARVRLSDDPRPNSRLVIRPWPDEWCARLTTRSGLAFDVRPVLPDDEAALAEFFSHVSPEDLRFRFLTTLHEVGAERLAVMTQIDYRRTMNFIALAEDGAAIIATAMLVADPGFARAEVAISTRSDRKGQGVSWSLLEHVIRYARAEGIGSIESIESRANAQAIGLEREMGFVVEDYPGDPSLVVVRRQLTDALMASGRKPG